MLSFRAVVQSNVTKFCGTLFLCGLYGFFSYVHIIRFISTFEITLFLIVLFETIAIFFLITRSDYKTISTNPSDWLIAIAGTFLPLFLRPASYSILPAAEIILGIGLMLQIMSLLSLNRSFALVPANRQIKNRGAYRYVRHPLYASYLLTFGSYVLVHTTANNVAIYIAFVILLCLRIFREERHLSLDLKYAEYMTKVKYRIIPFIF